MEIYISRFFFFFCSSLSAKREIVEHEKLNNSAVNSRGDKGFVDEQQGQRREHLYSGNP